MIMATDTNVGCFDFYAAYNTRCWMGVERPYVTHNRVRLLSHFFRAGK